MGKGHDLNKSRIVVATFACDSDRYGYLRLAWTPSGNISVGCSE